MSASRVPADPGEAGPGSPMRSMPHATNSIREDDMASSWLGTNSSPAHRSPVQGSPHYYHQGNMPLRRPSQQDGDPEELLDAVNISASLGESLGNLGSGSHASTPSEQMMQQSRLQSPMNNKTAAANRAANAKPVMDRYADGVTQERLGLPELWRGVMDMQANTERLRQSIATKAEVAASKSVVEIYARNLVNREHQQAERRMNDIAGTLASAIEEAVSGKADWNRVTENFAHQTRLIVRAHADAILADLEHKVVATLRDCGLENLHELSPTESSLGEFRMQISRMESTCGELGVVSRAQTSKLQSIEDTMAANKLEASSQLEVGLYRLKTELNERLTKINVGVKEMALDAARVVFDEKIVLALEPVRKELEDNQRQCRDLWTAMRATEMFLERRIGDLGKEVEGVSRRVESMHNRVDLMTKANDEIKAVMARQEKNIGDNAIKTKALEDRIRKQEELNKRDSNELQERLRELMGSLAQVKDEARDDKRTLNTLIDRVHAKEERLEKDLFRMKETLAKSVSYNEFTLMMQRVVTIEGALSNNRLDAMSTRVDKMDEAMQVEFGRLWAHNSKVATSIDLTHMENKLQQVEKESEQGLTKLRDKISDLQRLINTSRSELKQEIKEAKVKGSAPPTPSATSSKAWPASPSAVRTPSSRQRMERSFTARAPPPAVPAPPSSITLSLPSTPRGSARKDSLRGDSNLDDSAVEPVEPLPAPNTPSARQSPKARTPKRSSGARPPPIQVAAGEGAVVPEGPVLGFEEDHEVVIVPSLEEVRFQDVFKDQLEGTQPTSPAGASSPHNHHMLEMTSKAVIHGDGQTGRKTATRTGPRPNITLPPETIRLDDTGGGGSEPPLPPPLKELSMTVGGSLQIGSPPGGGETCTLRSGQLGLFGVTSRGAPVSSKHRLAAPVAQCVQAINVMMEWMAAKDAALREMREKMDNGWGGLNLDEMRVHAPPMAIPMPEREAQDEEDENDLSSEGEDMDDEDEEDEGKGEEGTTVAGLMVRSTRTVQRLKSGYRKLRFMIKRVKKDQDNIRSGELGTVRDYLSSLERQMNTRTKYLDTRIEEQFQKHKTESTSISRSLTQNKKELETLILTSKADLSTRVAENSRKLQALQDRFRRDVTETLNTLKEETDASFYTLNSKIEDSDEQWKGAIDQLSRDIDVRQRKYEERSQLTIQLQMRVFRDSMMSAEERKALYMVLDKIKSGMESLKTDVMVHGVQIAQNRPKIHQLEIKLRGSEARMLRVESTLQDFLCANSSLYQEIRRERSEAWRRLVAACESGVKVEELATVLQAMLPSVAFLPSDKKEGSDTVFPPIDLPRQMTEEDEEWDEFGEEEDEYTRKEPQHSEKAKKVVYTIPTIDTPVKKRKDAKAKPEARRGA